jgi:hypothetical protein
MDRTKSTYGLGFKVSTTDEQMAKFIKEHSRTEMFSNEDGGTASGKNILDWMESGRSGSICEEFYDYESEVTGRTGLYGLIADVMTKETGLRFGYHRTGIPCDKPEYIVFPGIKPCEMNAEERDLTEDELRKILEAYIKDFDGQTVIEYVIPGSEYYD